MSEIKPIKYIISTAIILSCIFLILLLLFTPFLKENQENKCNYNSSYNEGWDAAKERLIETGYLFPEDESFQINNIRGEIIKKDENSISIKITPIHPFDSQDLDVRIIKINEKTQIIKLVDKDLEQIEKEIKMLEEDTKLLNETEEVFPQLYEEFLININKLKVGDRIEVYSQKENIAKDKEIIANKIETY